MKIKIYSTPTCSYCTRAKDRLKSENIEYEEIDLTTVEGAMDEFRSLLPGVTKVPQIFIDEVHIGGYQELVHYLEG